MKKEVKSIQNELPSQFVKQFLSIDGNSKHSDTDSSVILTASQDFCHNGDISDNGVGMLQAVVDNCQVPGDVSLLLFFLLRFEGPLQG